MDLSEVVALHDKSKGKINLEYKRPSGRIGHCYIDCDKPLIIDRQQESSSGRSIPMSGHDIRHVSAQWILEHMKFIHVEVYKQTKGVPIWVRPENLALQNQRKAAVVKTLYGSKQEV